jgi:hypothetical protein
MDSNIWGPPYSPVGRSQELKFCMADPLHVLRERTEGIFEIWSGTGNINKNGAILAHFEGKNIGKIWAKNCNIFMDIFGFRPNLKNPLSYFNQNIERIYHTKFHGPTTFLLGCSGGPQIGGSISTIKGQTNGLRRKPCKISKQLYYVGTYKE